MRIFSILLCLLLLCSLASCGKNDPAAANGAQNQPSQGEADNPSNPVQTPEIDLPSVSPDQSGDTEVREVPIPEPGKEADGQQQTGETPSKDPVTQPEQQTGQQPVNNPSGGTETPSQEGQSGGTQPEQPSPAPSDIIVTENGDIMLPEVP